ncbi:hypothetical protein [uncultured Tateyamaria sp.]|uniref:hypothetical protein n=1 Tax=uncultured Tateyamaria sp. TaxID=455651 RepID=UPI00260AA520|nr:hypothetical protein [uncultured Tateyamaria sp.]
MAGFRDAAPADWQIDNMSVGASPVSQFGARLSQDLSSYDHILVDAIPNDENLLSFVGAEPFYDALLDEILTTLAAQSNLVILGFCNRAHAQNRSAVYEKYEVAARRLNGVFVSVIDYALANYPEPVFLDGPHILPEIARSFGADLVSKLASFGQDVSVNGAFGTTNFAEIALSEFALGEQVTKKNSLLSDTFSRLHAGTKVMLQEPANVIGFNIDATMSYCDIRFVGPDGQRRIGLRYNMAENGFLAKFVPVPNGHLTNCIEVLEPGPDAEKAPHNRPTDPGGVRSVAMSRLLTWRR